MGLDIYLKKCPDLEAANAAEAAADAEKEALWEAVGSFATATEAQKKEIRARSAEIDAKHGIVNYEHHSVTHLDDLPSMIDSDHLFKVGYFRSSYNEGGIERVLRNLGIPGLHEIFDTTGDVHDVRPDWNKARARVNASIRRYAKHLASDAGKYLVTKIQPRFERGVDTEAQALAQALEWIKTGNSDFFSTGDGEYFGEGIKLRALVTKKFTPPDRNNSIERLINTPSLYAVYEKAPSDKEDWYLTALKIVRETCDYVIAQPDRTHYYLSWSG